MKFTEDNIYLLLSWKVICKLFNPSPLCTILIFAQEIIEQLMFRTLWLRKRGGGVQHYAIYHGCLYEIMIEWLFTEVGHTTNHKKSTDIISTTVGDLKTRKNTGTSCQIEIHFSSQTNKFLIKYYLLRFQISGGLIIFIAEHDYKVS